MTGPVSVAADVSKARAVPAPHAPAVPHYLERAYWWAYVHPNAVRFFDRQWLVNLILFGNYGRLRDAALADLGQEVTGRTLQVACCYGDLTPILCGLLAAEGALDVVDILPIQLKNLGRKLRPDARVSLNLGDSTALACADASYDQVLLFFLLHEQPEHARRATLAEALRVVKPGGKVVVVDFHRPSRWHLLRPLMWMVFRLLEPYAIELWRHELRDFMPQRQTPQLLSKRTYFGGLYQKLVLTR